METEKTAEQLIAEFDSKIRKMEEILFDDVDQKPKTNADRIRAMTDEELARFLSAPCECSVDPETDGYRECGNPLCIAYLVKWLQQPAEGD